MKRIHFICRGNGFRSRLAASYLLSKRIENLIVISSGTVAKKYAQFNGDLPSYTKHILDKHHLIELDKGTWDQLTASRIHPDDTIVVFGKQAYHELFTIAPDSRHRILIWPIPDTGELFHGKMTPQPNDPNVNDFAEENFERIQSAVNDLIKEMISE